ncbi:putative sigma-54 modulation protein [Roseivirga pacifica]|uniref:Putative sigma-54 modulation protein n=1 Tax=Roseivirga pacifica TaxID=1267423 RepID=A0A1I0N321_9BACT|nr:ribosome-associated translation inhibitor RaiA [Roseivirga pacifica]MCO6359428.1 ribosome-associated translation inhibitor RaiA [Roseivirga pacifica]MCO6366798.1 ribosome-associated translation inhibitor RaiA [Roseivirga pacifica]MCO6370670.1 ribosome-associated translation inhibitor RaiA [Roseivirga pacifica]MCO6374454.1 ribosome-associated translation inhibitor RaiA [Roseivirga pacifica]MCO6379713.1 ribosome-associated translation inhibitor RaiA [Roseivirga pacifica]
MKVQVQSVHFDADAKLIDFIQKKLDKLDTFYDRTIDAEVILRLNNEGIQNKTVEIKLNVPGEQLFAHKTNGSFEAATDHCTEALRRQIKKHKEKVLAH